MDTQSGKKIKTVQIVRPVIVEGSVQQVGAVLQLPLSVAVVLVTNGQAKYCQEVTQQAATAPVLEDEQPAGVEKTKKPVKKKKA